MSVDSKVKHIIRMITPEDVDFVYITLKKYLLTISIKMFEEIVDWIYEKAISFPLTENDDNESENRMKLFAKLCKLCAEIEVSASDTCVVQVITFQEILIKVILSDYERMSKQPSCEKKLLNWLKNFKGSEAKKLEWIQTNCVKMEKNEKKRALRSINFVMELFILDIVNLETLYKIVQFTAMMASLTSVIGCVHELLSLVEIYFKELKWPEDTRYEEFFNNVLGILNKLTIGENYKLIKRFQNLPVNSEERFEQVANIIFETAIEEPTLSATYAKLCKFLSKLQVKDKQGEIIVFRKKLITKVQVEFEKKWNENSGNWRLEEDYELLSGIHLEENKKKRYVGITRFISEIFHVGLLTPTIIYRCIEQFLKKRDELALECLCVLLTNSGKRLECNNLPNTKRLDRCFQIMTDLLHTHQVHSLQISSRVRYMLQDVVELRQNKWIPKERINQKLQ